MQKQWDFKLPVRVRFGSGVREEITAVVAQCGERVVLVGDAGVAELDFFKEMKNRIGLCTVFTDVEPNPTVANVDALAGVIREVNADVVVAVGGGSVLDCAKAACCLACTEEPSVRVFHTEGKKFGRDRVPLIAVPTTAGTGSEVTPFAVLDDREKGVKGPIASDSFYPRLALIDPELTYSLPLKITAATGLDALSHAMEGYWSKNHQPICDLMAMEAARLIFKSLPVVYADPSNAESRAAMSYAALLAGMAFQLPKNAMVHACSFPLSNRFHMPHGTACAFTLEFALKLNAPAMDGRMEAFARYCGFFSIEEMSAVIRNLKVNGGLPCTLKDAGIPKAEVSRLVEESFHPLMNNNPVPVTAQILFQMYEELAV
ncbi:MAG: iron-containing alcohol dehydrogenase [Kiritimatiellaceae bacterium]|nr:iron-containing alcohol dehydrogenase [Kiritimatiellaceae bacterium]